MFPCYLTRLSLIVHCRNSYEKLMKMRTETDMTVKQYVRLIQSLQFLLTTFCLKQEKQFTIIRELLKYNDRMSMLNEAEKRSLAFLKDGRRRGSLSPGYVMIGVYGVSVYTKFGHAVHRNVLSDSCGTISASDISIEATENEEASPAV